MQRQRTSRKVLLLIAALAMVAASCGRSDDNSGSGGGGNTGGGDTGGRGPENAGTPSGENEESKLAAMRQRRQALAEQQRPGAIGKGNNYLDLKTRVQNKLLSVAIRGDMARPEIAIRNPFSSLFGGGSGDKRPLPLPPWASLPPRF